MSTQTSKYQIGDLLIPAPKVGPQRQLFLPFLKPAPVLIVGREKYISDNPEDCQSNFPEDIRWLIYDDGNILYCTEFLLDTTYECG